MATKQEIVENIAALKTSVRIELQSVEREAGERSRKFLEHAQALDASMEQMASAAQQLRSRILSLESTTAALEARVTALECEDAFLLMNESLRSDILRGMADKQEAAQ